MPKVAEHRYKEVKANKHESLKNLSKVMEGVKRSATVKF